MGQLLLPAHQQRWDTDASRDLSLLNRPAHQALQEARGYWDDSEALRKRESGPAGQTGEGSQHGNHSCWGEHCPDPAAGQVCQGSNQRLATPGKTLVSHFSSVAHLKNRNSAQPCWAAVGPKDRNYVQKVWQVPPPLHVKLAGTTAVKLQKQTPLWHPGGMPNLHSKETNVLTLQHSPRGGNERIEQTLAQYCT